MHTTETNVEASPSTDVLFTASVPGLPIVVDMSDLDFMDCGGYRAIVAAVHTAQQHDTMLAFANARGEPARFLGFLDELGLL